MVSGERSADGVEIDATYQHISEAPAYQDPDGETVADDEPLLDDMELNAGLAKAVDGPFEIPDRPRDP